MPKITYTSNIKDIIKSVETAQTNLKQAKIDGFNQIAKAAFNQVGNKYIVKGNYAEPSKTGKTLTYLPPPGGNIYRKTWGYNKKTKIKYLAAVSALWVAGKIVSRSGKYQNLLDKLAQATYTLGSKQIDDVRVAITENSLKIYSDDQGEFFKLETFKQAGKSKVQPVTKAFRSVVNLWKSVRIKLGK